MNCTSIFVIGLFLSLQAYFVARLCCGFSCCKIYAIVASRVYWRLSSYALSCTDVRTTVPYAGRDAVRRNGMCSMLIPRQSEIWCRQRQKLDCNRVWLNRHRPAKTETLQTGSHFLTVQSVTSVTLQKKVGALREVWGRKPHRGPARGGALVTGRCLVFPKISPVFISVVSKIYPYV